MNILNRITELRDERGWSNNHLAKMSDLPQSTVSNLYNRPYEPSISTLESLCNGFGISFVEFFNIDNEAIFLSVEQKKVLDLWTRLTKPQKESFLNLMMNI